MYISLKDSCAEVSINGPTLISQKSRMILARAGSAWSPQVLIKKSGVDITEGPHHPWVVLGAGTL